MADSNEVLGISGQLDISKIEESITNLCSSLQRIGVETDALSANMTKALNDIAKSDDDLSTKTQQAMSVLKQAMDEAKAGMVDVPSMIQIAQSRVDTYAQSIQTLNDKLAESKNGGADFGEINQQIANQQAALADAKERVEDLTQSYAHCKEELANSASVYDALSASSTMNASANSVQSASNAAVATTSSAATNTIGAQAASHITNAAATQQDAQSTNEYAEATKTLTQRISEYISTSEGRADIERMQGENSKKLADDIKMYQDSIKAIQEQLQNTDFTSQITNALEQIEAKKEKIASIKEQIAQLTPENDPTGGIAQLYTQEIEKQEEKIASLNEKVDAQRQTQTSLNAELETYNTLLGAAQQIASGKTLVVDSSMSYAQLNTELATTKQNLQELKAKADELRSTNPTDEQKAKLQELDAQIANTQEKINLLKEAIRAKQGETFVGTLRNKLSDLGTKIVEVGTYLKEKIETPFVYLGEKISNTSFFQRFVAELEQVKGAMGDVKDKTMNLITGNGKLQKSFGDMSKALEGMGLPLNRTLKGISGVTKALWGMCATPVGAVLAAIILALKAVQTWMTKSANGQKVYTKLMAYFGSIAKSVTDLIVILGEWLYNAFTNANGPLRDFGNNFVYTFKTAVSAVATLLKGLFHTVKGVLTFDWDTAGQGLDEIWNGVKKTGEAVVGAFKTQASLVTGAVKLAYNAFTDGSLGSQLGNVLGNIFSNAEKAAEIAGKQQETQIKLNQAKEKEAQLDIVIAEKQEQIYKLSGKAKDNAIEELKAIKKHKYDEQIKSLKTLLELLKQKNSLHTKSLEDIAAERQLSITLLKTQAQRAASTRMLTRMQEANRRKMEATARREAKQEEKQTQAVIDANDKYDELSYKNIEDREKYLTELELKVADARVTAMREGFEKTQAERKRQQEKEITDLKKAENAAIDAETGRQKKEFEALQAIRKAKGMSVERWDSDKNFEENDTVKAIRDYYQSLRTLTAQKQIEDERKNAESLVKSHQSYTDKKLAIDKKYKEDIASINAAIKEAEERYDKESVEALQRSKNQTTADYGKEKMKLGFEELKNSPEYVAAFTDIDKASTSTLNKLLSRFEEVKEGAAAALDPTSAKTYFDTISNLVDELVKRDPIGMAKQLSEQLKIQQEQLKQAEQILSSVQGGAQIMKSWKVEKTDDDTLQLVPVYYTLAEAEELVAQKSQEVANNQSKMTKAQKQTAKEIQNLISAFKSLGSAIGGEAGQIINLIGEIGSFVITTSNAMNTVSETASKAIQTLEKASAILTVIAGAIQIMSKITSLFKTADDYYTQYAKKQQEINKLRETVDDYRASVIKARQEEQNWFATTSLQNLKDKWASNAQAEENYYHTLYEAQEQYRDKSSGLSKYGIPIAGAIASVAIGAVTGGLGSLVTALGTSLGSALATTAIVGAAAAISGYATNAAAQAAISKITYQNGQTAAINNLRIQTQHKSFWRGQKTEDLRDWVRNNLTDDLGNPAELFDEQGLVNLEVANAVLNKYGDKLTGETKETLEKLVEQREKIDEYIEELQSYVSDTYSPLVDDMTDAIWSWLAEGKDALAEFKNSASSTFQDIGKEMIKQMLLKTVFDGFQDKLTDLYKQYAAGSINDTQLAEQMGSIMGTVVDSMNTELPGLEKFAENYRDILAKYGFDVTGNAEQSATSKGVTSITYDQANLLVNLATARNISLEKGNEIRQQILEALINQGYVANDTIPTTTDNSSQIVVDTSDNSSDAQAALYESLLKGFSNYDTDIAETTQGGDLKSYLDSANALLLQMASEYNSNMLSNSTLLAMMYSQQEMGIDISGLRVSATQMQSDISVMRDIQEQGLTQINKIELNTRPISEILETLNDIYRYQRDNM